jgi:uncharacterized protein
MTRRGNMLSLSLVAPPATPPPPPPEPLRPHPRVVGGAAAPLGADGRRGGEAAGGVGRAAGGPRRGAGGAGGGREGEDEAMTTRDGTPTLLLYPSGVFFNPLDPDPSRIHVRDVAHSLAAIPRFGGHTVEPYSVAQHSVLVSRVVELSSLDARQWALWGLLHEVAEALSGFGDVCGPIKRVPHVAAVVKPIERAIEAAAAKAWGFPPDFASCPVVKAADRFVLDWEDRDLRWEDAPSHLGALPRTWRPEDLGPPAAGADVVLPEERIVAWSFEVARFNFLERYAELTR